MNGSRVLATLFAGTLLILTLAGCTITFSGTITVDLPPGMAISNATYGTNYRAVVDGVEQPVICDDRTTLLTYGFDYVGELRYWTSYLRGVRSGDVRGRATFYPSSPGVTYTPESVEVTYRIDPYASPLAAADLANAQSLPQTIIVVPAPRVIGEVQLFVNINGFRNDYRLISRSIPVLASCP